MDTVMDAVTVYPQSVTLGVKKVDAPAEKPEADVSVDSDDSGSE